MPAQVKYYNHFGEQYKVDILTCPEPHLWTTDYKEKGRIYNEIKERIDLQEKLINKNFTKDQPILDIGCGFGRQAYILAKNGFEITGTDTSDVFIDIANELFKKHRLNGTFICTDLNQSFSDNNFQQILLLDVLEHIVPKQRKNFLKRISSLTAPKGKLILSLPFVKKRFTSQVNNTIVKSITQHLTYFKNREEHPYPIPQRNQIKELASEYFTELDYFSTPTTDYYVFEKC